MSTPFLYPGKGERVKQATSTSNNLQNGETIAIGGYSQWIGASDCLELMFQLDFAAAATGDVVIEEQGVAGNDELDTEAVVTQNSLAWRAGAPLSGQYRVFNDTDAACSLYVQKRIN
jgi:hypothetical protein